MTQRTNPHARTLPTPPSPDAIARRTVAIRGDGPRVLPIEIEALSPDLQAILTRMATVNDAVDSREKEMLTDLLDTAGPARSDAEIAADVRALPEIVRTMLRHGGLFGAQTDIGIQLLSKGALSPRDRELAVLRIGWLCQAPYEFGEHVMIAHKVGITPDEVDRVKQGSAAPGWNADELAILRATEELYADAMISDETWAMLAARLDEAQLIELPILVGQYQTVAYYQNALRLRLHEGNAGLDAR